MAKHVNIAAVQFVETNWLNKPDDAEAQVLRELSRILTSLKGYGLDLVVISEIVECYAQTLKTAEDLANPGPVLNVYRDFARAEHCHVAGSAKTRKGNAVYNSLVFIDPTGAILGAYHKTNVTLGEIEEGLRSGQGAVVVDTAIGRLGGAICFDLNFESLRDQYRALKPDILCFASMFHGGLQQALWAYECRSFFVSSLPFSGGGILDPYGRAVKLTDCYNRVARDRVNLDRVIVHLDYNLGKFPLIEKKYKGQIIIDIPPNIGSALITSNTDRVSAMDIVREFKLELLDDYFARSLAANDRNR